MSHFLAKNRRFKVPVLGHKIITPVKQEKFSGKRLFDFDPIITPQTQVDKIVEQVSPSDSILLDKRNLDNNNALNNQEKSPPKAMKTVLFLAGIFFVIKKFL